MAHQTYNINITVTDEHNQSSNVPYAQLTDQVSIDGVSEKDQFEHGNNGPVISVKNDSPKYNKPLGYFIVGYNFAFIVWLVSAIAQIFDLTLISIFLLAMISMIAVKWVDRGCLCIGSATCSCNGVTDCRLTLIWLHLLCTIIFGICAITYYEWKLHIIALIAAIIAFLISQTLGIMALWKRKRVQH